ncbi:MAG TPA: PH domain-containing protein [Actinophytocola sp.]|uniref:PH domain-containing protein n=1 Tax=Actinophytocola sp. TaxID=1872138 RepID=UPI002DB912F2|nr:PH domain-containing protein [Actinophytocola sp.]HEU5472671.1 PH domain-containing protein [Actinophytocola sp.]
MAAMTEGGAQRFRSPWRWLTVPCGAFLALIGVGMFTTLDGDAVTIAFTVFTGLICIAGGGWLVAYLLQPVVVRRDCVTVRSGFGRRRIPVGRIRSVQFGAETHHLSGLTTRFPVLHLDDDETVALTDLAWYSFRRDRLPRRIVRFEKAVRRRIAE